MIAAIYYEPIFVIITLMLSIVALNNYKKNKNSSTLYMNVIYVAILLSFFIGFRPLDSIFADMWNYNNAWGRDIFLGFDWSESNFIFDNIFKGLAAKGVDIQYFFLLISFIYFIVSAWSCIKLFKKNALVAYAVFLGAFSTFSYSVNGIKAGAAAALFMLALAYYNNKKVSLLILLLSLGFHHSMIMPIFAFILSYIFKQNKYYLFFWVICLGLSAVHITTIMNFLGTLLVGNDDHGASYLFADSESAYVTGFRLDFILYSAMPIIIGYVAIFKRGFIDKTYSLIWRTYVLANSVWLLCMYASYTNRIAYLSWCIYPFVLLYPFVHENSPMNSKSNLKKVIYSQLLFTIFMNLIYKYIR